MNEQSLSTINIPLTIGIKEIEETINGELKGILYEDNSMENNGGDNLMIKAEKSENITISMNGQRADYRVQLKLWVKKDIGISYLEASGEIALNFSTSFKIGTDWKLNTITEVIDHQWLRKPAVHLGRIKLPIKFIGNRVLKKSQLIIGKSIDQELQNHFDLRRFVVEAWHQLQQPVLLSDEYDFWISIIPKELGMTEFETDEENIFSTIFIHAHANANIGEKPEPQSSVLLPSFQLIEEENEEFRLILSTFIPFEEAEKIAVKHLEGEIFSSGNKSVKVEDIKVFGRGDKIVVDASLKGAFNGDIYLTGKPVYNNKTNELELEDLEYEINTRNFLMKSASWLFKKEIEKRLKKELRFPLKENLEELEKIVETELENYALAPNAFLRGNLHHINFEHTELLPIGIRIIIASSGKLNLIIKGFLLEE